MSRRSLAVADLLDVRVIIRVRMPRKKVMDALNKFTAISFLKIENIINSSGVINKKIISNRRAGNKKGEAGMNETTINVRKLYETLARIISEREQVKITVNVREKDKKKGGKRKAA